MSKAPLGFVEIGDHSATCQGWNIPNYGSPPPLYNETEPPPPYSLHPTPPSTNFVNIGSSSSFHAWNVTQSAVPEVQPSPHPVNHDSRYPGATNRNMESFSSCYPTPIERSFHSTPLDSCHPSSQANSSCYPRLNGDMLAKKDPFPFGNENEKGGVASCFPTAHGSGSPLPPGMTLLWENNTPVQLFFVQEEGHIVSIREENKLNIYKLPNQMNQRELPRGSLSGNALGADYLIIVGTRWRIGLKNSRDFIVKGVNTEFAFLDKSTNPPRVVVLKFINELREESMMRLEILLKAMANMSEEPSNVVDKLDAGVGSVYNTFTSSINNLVKDNASNVHKNTKWFRKNTGNLIRKGGGLLSQGAHLITDPFLDKEDSKPKNAQFEHGKLIKAISDVRSALKSDQVTFIQT